MTEITDKRRESSRIGVGNLNGSNERQKIKRSFRISKRREPSTSPDEGIAHSPEESRGSPASVRKKMPTDLQEFRDSRRHIAITIKGGLTREVNKKKKTSRQEKGKHKLCGTSTLTESEKGKHKSTELEQVQDRRSRRIHAKITTKTHSLHMSGATPLKNVVSKVVDRAHIENSVAKKNRPIWVEITKKVSSEKEGQTAKNILRIPNDILTSSAKNDDRIKKLSNFRHNKSSKHVHHTNRITRGATRRSKPHGSERHTKIYRDQRTRRCKTVGDLSESTKAKNKNDQLVKSDVQRANSPGTPQHLTQFESQVSMYRDRKTSSKHKTTKTEVSETQRSESADSSVRYLSCPSSSSLSKVSNSSSVSYTTTSASCSEFTSSSSSCSLYCTSSTNHSSVTSSASSKQRSSLKQQAKGAEGREMASSAKRQSRKAKIKDRDVGIKNCEERDIVRRTEYNKKDRRRWQSRNDCKQEGDTFNLKPMQKITKEIERNIGGGDEQEFDVNLEKRRKRNRRPQLNNHEATANDIHKNQWQHQRLVMTSHAPTNAQVQEKTRQIVESSTRTQGKSFEASTKDSIGTVLTIRDLYSLHHVISDTRNGTVIAGHRRSDGTRVAIKRIAKSDTTRWGWMNGKVVPLELALICQVNEVRHVGVVEIVEWHETTEAFLLVMVRPNPSVDLYDYVTKRKSLKESVAKQIIRQLVLALSHCWKMGVLHRDVKLENILFNPITMETILIDFGCGDYSRSGTYTDFAGTPEYYPPEWFLYKQYSGNSATVWSIGVLIYSLLCGTLPFRSSKDIVNKELAKFPADISKTAIHLIGETVKKNSRERIELMAILDHPWFTTSKESSEISKTSV